MGFGCILRKAGALCCLALTGGLTDLRRQPAELDTKLRITDEPNRRAFIFSSLGELD